MSGEGRAGGDEHPRCTASTARCEFWSWSEDYVRPDCCTEHLLDLTVFTDRVLRDHGFLHWLDYGSLLGAVRAGELIPWDSDVDFGCLESDPHKLAAIEPEVKAAGYELDLSDPHIARIYFSAVNRQHVDVFLWHDRDGTVSRPRSAGDEWPGVPEEEFPRGYLVELETVHLHGHPLPAPTPVHDFLSHYRFGPDYMTPTRGVFNAELVPGIGASDMTPVVQTLLNELGRYERRLIALDAKCLPTHGFRRRWAKAGDPRVPSRAGIERVAHELVSPSDRHEAVVETLLRSIALTRQGVLELEHPTPATWIKRLGRKADRVARLLARRTTHSGRPRQSTTAEAA
jgi:hypothetical protein